MTSGLIMMPLTLSMAFASTISGQLISRTGKYKIIVIFGMLIMGIGMFSLSFMNINSTITKQQSI